MEKQRLRFYVTLISILTISLGVFVITSNGGNVYFNWGPDKSLHFVSFTIDSWPKYIGVFVGIIPLAWMDVYTYDKVYPYFFSRIYVDEFDITDWNSSEQSQLAFWAELSYGAANFRLILDTLITVTNFYFAIWRWFLKEIMCICIINNNLTAKFKKQNRLLSSINEPAEYIVERENTQTLKDKPTSGSAPVFSLKL